MSDAQLSQLVGREVVNGRAGARHVFNHRWDDPASFATLGTIPAAEIEQLTGGRLSRDVTVALNKLPLEYDHVIVCGPVFPHEVVGFSGGTKYLFPGIAGAEIIHFTHWLGALITNYDVIGTKTTPVRAVIDRAASLLDRPLSLLAPVVMHEGVAGLFCGPVHEAWSAAADLSSKRHVVWLDEAGEARPLDHARHVRRPLGRGQGHVQDGAGGGRRGRGRHLRPPRHRGEPRPREADRRGRLPLQGLLREAVGPLQGRPGRHPGPLDPREGPGDATTPRPASRPRASASPSRPASRASAASASTSATSTRRASTSRPGRRTPTPSSSPARGRCSTRPARSAGRSDPWPTPPPPCRTRRPGRPRGSPLAPPRLISSTGDPE